MFDSFNISDLTLQPVLAKNNYNICKLQLFKKITISRKILNTRRLYLDCIRHFQARPHKAKFFEENLLVYAAACVAS